MRGKIWLRREKGGGRTKGEGETESRERQEGGGIEGKDTVEKREGGEGGRTKAGGERQTDTEQGGARWRRHRGERDC